MTRVMRSLLCIFKTATDYRKHTRERRDSHGFGGLDHAGVAAVSRGQPVGAAVAPVAARDDL